MFLTSTLARVFGLGEPVRDIGADPFTGMDRACCKPVLGCVAWHSRAAFMQMGVFLRVVQRSCRCEVADEPALIGLGHPYGKNFKFIYRTGQPQSLKHFDGKHTLHLF
jgi:hypothetical protein